MYLKNDCLVCFCVCYLKVSILVVVEYDGGKLKDLFLSVIVVVGRLGESSIVLVFFGGIGFIF